MAACQAARVHTLDQLFCALFFVAVFGRLEVLSDEAGDEAVPEGLQAVQLQEVASLGQLGESKQLVEDRKEAVEWTQVGALVVQVEFLQKCGKNL